MKKRILCFILCGCLAMPSLILASCNPADKTDSTINGENGGGSDNGQENENENQNQGENTDSTQTPSSGENNGENTGENTGENSENNVENSENNGENSENSGGETTETVEVTSYIEFITYNIAFYEATASSMNVKYEGQSYRDYTIAKRALRLASLLESYTPDVVALQEVNRLWWPYLISNSDSVVKSLGYEWTGNMSAFRSKDGNGSADNDLYNLILWNPEKFELVEEGMFRFSIRPTGDANTNRFCTYAILKNRETGIETLYASTHLCTRGNTANMELNVKQSESLTKNLLSLAGDRMIVVGGDFNMPETFDSYKHITETAGFSDAKYTAKIKYNQTMSTARMWGEYPRWNSGDLPIDHIFCYGNTASPELWKILYETFDSDNKISDDIEKVGVYYDLSDHLGVYTKFKETATVEVSAKNQ